MWMHAQNYIVHSAVRAAHVRSGLAVLGKHASVSVSTCQNNVW